MKSLMLLLGRMLEDLSIQHRTDTRRDAITAFRRVEHEGISFLTISLTKFCQDFERSIEAGLIDSTRFLGYKKRASLPAFLQGLTSLVFDPTSGRLLDKPDPIAVKDIRQFCLMWKKINLPCSKERVAAAFDQYVKTDQEVGGTYDSISAQNLLDFRKVSRIIWSEVLQKVDFRLTSCSLTPRHGPGATAERILGNKKYALQNWHTRLESAFPFDQFGLTSLNNLEDGILERVNFLEPEAEPPVRVITVPKTLKTPRIIAIEPVCMQYTQQSLMSEITREIESHPFTSGVVNFSDQTVNQRLALESSKDGSYATLDLSEASDRVSLGLVSDMLGATPSLLEAVLACRSTRANLPGDITITLNKFASMGSALCFPIESMLFYTVSILAVIKELNLPLTRNSITSVKNFVYVYGDDIIVVADKVQAVIRSLETFGLKVNGHKSFWNSRFRESCGMDAFEGVRVTPVYLRRLPPSSRRDVPEVVSMIAFGNQLYREGYWKTAKIVRELVERVIGPLPHVLETSPCLGWNSVQGHYTFSKWCKNTHAPLVKGYVVSAKKYDDPIEGYPALMKFFLRQGQDGNVLNPLPKMDLERSVRSGHVGAKVRWTSPY